MSKTDRDKTSSNGRALRVLFNCLKCPAYCCSYDRIDVNRRDIKRLAKLDAQIAEESKTVQDLRVKVAELERPARLEALATTYLGMKPVASSHETQLEALGDISRTTSRPVAAAASPETPASASSTDDLISKAESKAAQPVPVSLPKAEGAR